MSDTEKKIDDGGPAFPILDGSEAGLSLRHPGMSLRAWLAGKAMQSVMDSLYREKENPINSDEAPEFVADTALEFADALVAKLKAGQP